MPTKRTRRTRGRTVLTLNSLDLPEQIDLMIGWLEGRHTHQHWTTWQEYVAVYLQVREELLASEWMRDKAEPPFAEIVYQCWGEAGPPPGTDVWAAVQSCRNLNGRRAGTRNTPR